MADVELLERTLPHNIDAEKAVLGAVLVDGGLFAKAASVIGATDFFRDAHRRLFAHMAALQDQGLPVDYITLKDRLARHGELDEVGGPAYVSSLADGVPHSANVEAYAAIVREQARRRGLIFAANKVLADAYEAEEAPSAVADRGMTALLSFVETPDAGMVRAGEAMLAYAMALDAPATGSAQALATGFADLDEILAGGLRPATLTVVAGRPSHGKSSLCLCVLRSMAKHDIPCAIVSLEARADALAGRLLAFESRVASQRMTARFLGDNDHVKIAAALHAMEAVPLYIQDTAATLSEVSAWANRFKDEYGVRVLVVDYLQLMMQETRAASREQEVATLSKGLKRLARTTGLAIIAISALNRAPEGRKDNRPKLSDLRESGAIEYDADVALLVYRADMYDDAAEAKGLAEVIVAKQKEGPLGTVKLAFIEDLSGLFENLAVQA